MTFIYHASENVIREKTTRTEPYKSYFNTRKSGVDMNSYSDALDNYNQHIASLKSYPCHISCKEVWKDGEDVTGKYGLKEENAGVTDDGQNYITHLTAYPLTTQSESEDELWDEALEISIKTPSYEETKRQWKQSFTISRKQ